ncbi:N-alpha-acetyl diaminobutyric acid deacetylase DoeB [Mesorhizobium japonicum]|uniref:N-alpha-acetyl diaminobutyric acid deacetylase DoeB n=2 Tax=Mesorhizobium TaxID=68287 RepID=A0A1A5JFA0_RHILI|nr:N-alpha-acetyl diaminobutyric acid deacetylase DoeB [Mesorhizobium loti]QJF04158.1 N-alpha-acetyl diaminobutyric acid deacetylase DoeB [Mesorhizobium japonicum R7A]QJF10227.1 N-alpha-acetyl diaminobutyric acid deacetylase DoeB [Mesorhizobium japonicum]OBP77453.1 N-alpha-acetyl diaminobutyric acid deacetylase DoeB [Mesorhizobium loti]OBP81456.1 N-alpha-acetyl diaminobutyric acid deacetylase DoeB [Mesorhizobium loti]
MPGQCSAQTGGEELSPISSLRPSPIAATVDFDRDGVQHGFLRLPYSRDDSAWGSVMIPICVIRNGKGPTALLSGGNHGDEYEGPLALYDLARALDSKQVSGTVIIIPAMNYPAFRAGTRTSPIDKGNMNRSFPGRPDGTVTEKIADYFQRELLPRADIVFDFHSGGKTLDFVPFCAAHTLPDKVLEQKAFDAVAAFSAPFSMRMIEIDSVGMYDTAAEEMGKVFVSTELGGGGTSRAQTVRIARRGILNVLRHAGIVAGAVEKGRTQWLDMPSGDCFSFADEDGMIETMVDLGEPVEKDAVLARIHSVGRTGIAPQEIRAKMSGMLAARHFPGLVKAGDCAAVVAVEVD